MRKYPPRWRIEILSPVDYSVIWKCDAYSHANIYKKWFAETGNTYLNKPKINRLALGGSIGKLTKTLIRFYKIGSFAQKTLTEEDRKKYDIIELENEPELSDCESCSDDYSTCYETTDSESGDETETETEE